MDKESSILNKGDNSVLLQDIQTNGGNIIINLSSDLPPEVKVEKEKIAKKIQNLAKELSELSNIVVAEHLQQEYSLSCDKDEINWTFLIEAIKDGGCVLFIGQDISCDESGNSIHEKFYEDLEKEFNIEYLSDEGFFAPFEGNKIIYRVKKFYKQVFHQQNIIGNDMLMRLAEIPLSLIISFTPDNAMHRVFQEFEINHQYRYNDGTSLEIEKPTKDNPLVYNIFGEAEKYEFIYTLDQFYEFYNKFKIHPEVKKKLQDATHYLFVGFDFNKWYNRLLLLLLDIRKTKRENHAIETIITKDDFKLRQNISIKNIANKQFDITFVSDNYYQFINKLLYQAKQENILNCIHEDFIVKYYSKLKDLSIDIIDKNKLRELSEIDKTLDHFELKIATFKKNL